MAATRGNLWSPDEDDEGAPEPGGPADFGTWIIEQAGRVNPALHDQALGIINVENNERKQIITIANPEGWTVADRHALTAIIDGVRTGAPLDHVPPGMNRFAEYLEAAGIGDAGTAGYRQWMYRWGTIPEPTTLDRIIGAVAAGGRAVADAVVNVATNAINAAAAFFGAIRLWGGQDPTWLKLVNGNWLEAPPWARLGEGYCSYAALAAAGYTKASLGPSAQYNSITVDGLTDILERLGRRYELYDALGTRVREGGTKAHKSIARMIVADGHLTAFSTKCPKNVFELNVPPKPDTQYKELEDLYKFRSTLSIHNELFRRLARNLGPRYFTAQGISLSYVDLNCAYPNIIEDPLVSFPRFDGTEVIDTNPGTVSTLIPYGFYLVESANAAETLILGGGSSLYWTTGKILTTLRSPPYAYLSAYIAKDSTSGRPWVTDIPLDIKRQALRCYSGQIEATNRITDELTIATERTSSSEAGYLNIAARTLGFDLAYSLDSYRVRRTRSYVRDGRLSKAVIYAETAARLLAIHRDAGSPRIIAIRTDAIYWDIDVDIDRLSSVRTGMAKGFHKRASFGSSPWPCSVVRYEYPPSLEIAYQGGSSNLKDKILGSKRFGCVVFGPPGSGKTRLINTEVTALCASRDIPLVRLTPTRELAADPSHGSGWIVFGSLFRPSVSVVLLRRLLREAVVVVDEIGLLRPSQLVHLININPQGVILVGDRHQLCLYSLPMMARGLGFPVITLAHHPDDRFKGDERMKALLAHIAIYINDGSNVFEPFPATLLRTLPQYIKIYDTPTNRPAAETIGWRHKYVDPINGSTIHSAQGKTIEGLLRIIDWSHCTPALLYTAVSRARSIDDIELVR